MRTLWTLFITFFKIGTFTFGGGLAMLPFIQDEMVRKHQWLTEEEMLDIVAIAESTPGVIAVNTATFVGYKVKKFWGSLVATLGVVIPSIIIICVIALYFKDFLAIPAVAAIFKGIRAGVSVLIFNAAFKIFKKVKKEAFTYILMGLAFLVSLLVPIDSIFIILGGALASILYHVVIHKGEAHAA
jgi:chromate transporter